MYDARGPKLGSDTSMESPANASFPTRLPARVYNGSENLIDFTDISPRLGFSYALDEARKTVHEAVLAALGKGEHDIESMQRVVRRAAGKFVADRTKRRPMIVPVVMTI